MLLQIRLCPRWRGDASWNVGPNAIGSASEETNAENVGSTPLCDTGSRWKGAIGELCIGCRGECVDLCKSLAERQAHVFSHLNSLCFLLVSSHCWQTDENDIGESRFRLSRGCGSCASACGETATCVDRESKGRSVAGAQQ